MKRKNNSTRMQAYGWLLLSSVIWGAAFVFIKPALEYITPFRFLFYRYVVATSISLFILIIFKKNVHFDLKVFAVSCANELIGTGIALSFFYWGMSLTTSIEASIVTLLTPLLIVAGGVFILKEKETKREILGLVVAIIGIALIIATPIFSNNSSQVSLSRLGGLLLLFSSFADATYILIAKKIYPKKSQSLLLAAAASSFVGLIFFFFLSLLEHSFSFALLYQTIISDLSHPIVWMAVIYMGVLGSLLALFALFKGQSLIEVSEAALFRYSTPIISIPLGVYFLHESLSIWQLIGFITVVAGIVLVETKRTKSKHS